MRFNGSGIKLWLTCHQQYIDKRIDRTLGGPGGLVHRTKRFKPPATFGTAFHAAATHLVLNSQAVEAAIADGVTVLQKEAARAEEAGAPRAAERILNGTGGFPYPCKTCEGRGHSKVKMLPCKNCAGSGVFKPATTEGIAYFERFIRAYAQEWPAEDWDVVSVEEEYEYPLANGHTLIGRIDLIYKWNGHLWILDHKTCSRSTSFEFEVLRYELDLHTAAIYPLVASGAIGGLPHGFQINFARKVSKPEEGGAFYRQPYALNKDVLAKHLAFLERVTTEMAEAHATWPNIRPELAQMNPSSCLNYMALCASHDFCTDKIPRRDREALEAVGFMPRDRDYVDEPEPEVIES